MDDKCLCLPAQTLIGIRTGCSVTLGSLPFGKLFRANASRAFASSYTSSCACDQTNVLLPSSRFTVLPVGRQPIPAGDLRS